MSGPAIPVSSCPRSNKPARAAAVGYWQLVAAGEPFRLLFPVGAAIGICGVLLWPLFVWKAISVYPGPFHAKVMIEGFLASFVIGFLGTALPRLLGVPRITIWESVGFAGALVTVASLQATRHPLAGDLSFFCALSLFVCALGIRALIRKDSPPPSFLLVALGILSALVGVALQIIGQVAPSLLPESAAVLGRLLLNQGFVLLPIMGVGAFLLPRFFDLPSRQSFPESAAMPPEWGARACFALACGLSVLVGFFLEARGFARWGCGFRAVAFVAFFVRELPVHRAGFSGGSLAHALRLALFSIPSGYVLMSIWPERTTSLLHIVFITGFSLITFAVATRVVLGHSGQAAKFQSRLWPVIALATLVVFAMLTRVSADWMPAIRLSHYAYAAIIWAAGVLIWALAILPSVSKADKD